MRRAVASRVRSFFRVLAIPAFAAIAACASAPPEFEASDAATSGRSRADEWRNQGLYPTAARQYEEASRLAGDEGDLSFQIRCLFDASETWLLAGRPSVAEIDVQQAERVIPHLPVDGSKRRLADYRLAAAKGDLALLGNRFNEARAFYEEALAHALGPDRDIAAMRLSLLAEKMGDAKRARWYSGQVADRANPRLAELRKMLIDNGTPSIATTAPQKVAVPAASASAPVSAVVAPTVHPRSEWGARRMNTNLDRMTGIYRITVHHTATRLNSNYSRAAADEIRKFQKQHQDEKGWADIGYHFIIDPAGRIWEGRPLQWQGAHAGTPDLNVGNIGIALIGDFEVDQPTPSQKKSLADLLNSLCLRYHVDKSHVYTHKEIRPGPTECPGPSLQHVVEQWRAQPFSTL
jgi:tetratricopeptide (TPR) repeat protein